MPVQLPTFLPGEIAPYRDVDTSQFIGKARVHLVSEGVGTSETAVRAVTFEPGARSRPHRHSCDQLLYFLEAGIVAIGGGEDQPVEAGRLVLLPGGVCHMHGAGPDAPAAHLSIMREIDSDFETDIPEVWRHLRASEP
jgi:quercetin dioxygenase-like cupin family protein